MKNKRMIMGRSSVRRVLSLAAFLVFHSLFFMSQVSAQRFFNLTVDDIRIDSLLPEFTYSVPLGYHYADSTYEVEILYPDFIDMSRRDIARYQAITSDALPAMPVVTTRTVVERKQGHLELSFVPMVERDGKYQFLVSFMLKVTARPKAGDGRRRQAMRASSEAKNRYAGHSVLSSGRWVKIRVPSSGVYQLTDALIRQAGFSNPARVRIYGYGGNLQNEQLVGEELAMLDDLPEVPTCTVGGRRLFYGKGPVSWSSSTATRRTRNPYSDYGYYFLTESDGEPLTVDSATFVGSFYPSNDDYHLLHEVDGYAWYHGGRNLFDTEQIQQGRSRDYVLSPSSSHVSAGTLSVCVTAGSASTVEVRHNGTQLGTLTLTSLGQYEDGKQATGLYELPQLAEKDTVSLTVTAGGPVRLDYISMTLDECRAAPNLAASWPSPEYVYAITNQDHHADAQADMVIIIPTSQRLLAQAQRLADFHASHDGLRVNIVPADELYNEFSSGTPDANAYRRYLKMLYDRADGEADMPRYLLLFGDCVFDNRMLTTDCRNLSPDDYLLAFESENSFSHTYCYIDDCWFSLLDDGEGVDPETSDKLDLGVGRFPVTTDSEAKIMVDKTISYIENANAGDWENVLMFMGDDGDQNRHMIDLNETAETISRLYPGFQVKKVMWDAYNRETSSTGNTYPQVTSVIKQQQAAGALIMDYAGHGKEIQLSHETVLRITDFQEFSNTNLPLWVTASCDIMPYDAVMETIGESAVLNKKGGAVAFYGTTRTVYAPQNKILNTTFLRHVLSIVNGKPVTLGEAQRLAKNEMITSRTELTTNKLQYALLGDPALALNRPTVDVIIDEINGVSTSADDMPVLKAGSLVTVKGHISSFSSKMADFNGRMTATVRDTRELIVCKQNDPREAEIPFQFYDRQKVLYNGSDSVRNGEFQFTFPVPMDINYADGTGLINVYAVNNAHTIEAHGACEQFRLNGTQVQSNDSIGPSIYCYLNSPSFVNGGNVNSTPYFVAQVTDKDGINATGSGIGHDLQLTIDGDMQKTYNLNEHFTYDFGSYTSGSTFYSIPELEPGMHTLKFRAWDIQNNSSTAVLQFNVVKGLQPDLFSVSCTNNPATTSTTFIVTHNRTGSQVDVEIEVFDMSGRLLWQYAESGVSTDNTYTVDWDLTVDGGQRLQTGVYLYRVCVGSDGSSKASKARKLIII